MNKYHVIVKLEPEISSVDVTARFYQVMESGHLEFIGMDTDPYNSHERVATFQHWFGVLKDGVSSRAATR